MVYLTYLIVFPKLGPDFFLIQEFVFNRIIYHAKWLFELECFRMRTAKMWTHNSHSLCENMMWFRFRVNKNFIPFSVESEGMVILHIYIYITKYIYTTLNMFGRLESVVWIWLPLNNKNWRQNVSIKNFVNLCSIMLFSIFRLDFLAFEKLNVNKLSWMLFTTIHFLRI